MALSQTDKYDLGIALNLLKEHSKLEALVPLTVNEELIERYPGANDLPKFLGVPRSRFVELFGLSNCWVEKQEQKWVNVYDNWGLANYLDVDQARSTLGLKTGS